MKKFYGVILLFTALMAFKTNLQAQTYPCAGITTEAVGGGSKNTFRAQVTLDKVYNQISQLMGQLRMMETQTTAWHFL